MRSSASGEGERVGLGAAVLVVWLCLAVVAGLSWKAASMRWKKGATEGLEGFLLATLSRDETGAGFVGGGIRRSLRDWSFGVAFGLRSEDEEDDGMLSVLLGLVGFGDGR